MKALELTVHGTRRIQDGPDTTIVYYDTDYGRRVYDRRADEISKSKRLTDAELSAEVWRAKWTGLWAEHNSGLNDSRRAMIATVERFATLPHYDEDTK